MRDAQGRCEASGEAGSPEAAQRSEARGPLSANHPGTDTVCSQCATARAQLEQARAVLEELRPIIKSVLVEREELDESILGRIDAALQGRGTSLRSVVSYTP